MHRYLLHRFHRRCLCTWSRADGGLLPRQSRRLSDCITVFTSGFAIAPMVLAPFSELNGRRPVFIATGLLFVICQLCCAVTRSFGGMLAARFFVGVGGSTFSTLVGGCVSDMYHKAVSTISALLCHPPNHQSLRYRVSQSLEPINDINAGPKYTHGSLFGRRSLRNRPWAPLCWFSRPCHNMALDLLAAAHHGRCPHCLCRLLL